MNKTQAKEYAQQQLMHAAGAAWEAFYMERHDYTERQRAMVYQALDEQYTRMERLFGYDLGSWPRGT